jgi:predicted SnoaL-like aldol condensation-catalyzing enzyme
MFNQNKPTEAIKRYVGEVYIQHNPTVADGKKALIILRECQKSTLVNVSTLSG